LRGEQLAEEVREADELLALQHVDDKKVPQRLFALADDETTDGTEGEEEDKKRPEGERELRAVGCGECGDPSDVEEDDGEGLGEAKAKAEGEDEAVDERLEAHAIVNEAGGCVWAQPGEEGGHLHGEGKAGECPKRLFGNKTAPSIGEDDEYDRTDKELNDGCNDLQDKVAPNEPDCDDEAKHDKSEDENDTAPEEMMLDAFILDKCSLKLAGSKSL
jgi:hypothetical protein